MPSRLNISAIQEAMKRAGLNASGLADALGVSRQATALWLNGKSVPRPDKVLKMARLLDLRFEEIYFREDARREPVVAFRKKGNAITKLEHRERAKQMGKVLKRLVPGLPFDTFDAPVRIKAPSLDYDYIQSLVAHFRGARKLGLKEKIPFECLISEFGERQAVLVPVLWGNRKNHGNALHIYLPDSQVTWVYLNLESNLLDFKYWMAHELGHILLGEDSRIDDEEFCESFAAALLYPGEAAKEDYRAVADRHMKGARLNAVQDIALRFEVSPITIARELNRFATGAELPQLEFGDAIYQRAAQLNKRFPKVSELLFQRKEVAPDAYIEKTGKVFGSMVFDALRQRLKNVEDGAGLVQWTLDVSLADAKAIAQSLR